jgi:hypothetical protein
VKGFSRSGSENKYLSAFKVFTLFFEILAYQLVINFLSANLVERVLVIWPSGHLYVSHAPNGQLVRKETKRTVTFRHSKFNFVFRVVWQQTP